jgi:hypothetical protein
MVCEYGSLAPVGVLFAVVGQGCFNGCVIGSAGAVNANVRSGNRKLLVFSWHGVHRPPSLSLVHWGRPSLCWYGTGQKAKIAEARRGPGPGPGPGRHLGSGFRVLGPDAQLCADCVTLLTSSPSERSDMHPQDKRNSNYASPCLRDSALIGRREHSYTSRGRYCTYLGQVADCNWNTMSPDSTYLPTLGTYLGTLGSMSIPTYLPT